MFKIKQRLKWIIYALKNKAGFTVMETVVVLAIFTIAATYSLAIFVKSNTAQKRTANIQRSLSDIRYVLELMSREIRMGLLDYEYYGSQGISLLPSNMPLTADEAMLAIRDIDYNPVRFRRAESSTPGRYVIQYYYNNDWLDITPENINVSRLDFYLAPAENPFIWDSGYASNQQPWVTIILETESLWLEGGTLLQPRTSHFQTTVASRKYLR